MMDELSRLVANARCLVREGYYRVADRANRAPSFVGSLEAPDRKADVIAEIKFASPGRRLARKTHDFEDILARIVATKPLALSILAEPRIFGGSLDFVRSASRHGLPVLMKDIVVDPTQVEAAASYGASAVLVIQTLFSRGLLDGASRGLIDAAHDEHLDVVLEGERSSRHRDERDRATRPSRRPTRRRGGRGPRRHVDYDRPGSGSEDGGAPPWLRPWRRDYRRNGAGGARCDSDCTGVRTRPHRTSGRTHHVSHGGRSGHEADGRLGPRLRSGRRGYPRAGNSLLRPDRRRSGNPRGRAAVPPGGHPPRRCPISRRVASDADRDPARRDDVPEPRARNGRGGLRGAYRGRRSRRSDYPGCLLADLR